MDSVAPLRLETRSKTFYVPFTRRRIDAVRDVSFEVEPGEIFGFLGPNGAGKSTTIKMLMGLVLPSSGSAAIFGQPMPSPEALRRVGFLPETPPAHPSLTPRELVTLCGRLSGVPGRQLRERVQTILERTGVAEAMDRPLRTHSKGMLQRVGLAAALVHEPELLVLDEPTSGLDPVGRKDVRDLIVEQKRLGRTVLFSSHVLSDVEMLCDRVCILRRGEVVVSGKLSALLDPDKRRVEITIEGGGADLEGSLAALGCTPTRAGPCHVVEVEGDDLVRAVIERTFAHDARVVSVMPKRETLEDLFVRNAL